MDNCPRSEMGEKWPQNTEQMENWPNFPFIQNFSAIFLPFQLGAIFHVFSFLALGPLPIAYLPGMIAILDPTFQGSN